MVKPNAQRTFAEEAVGVVPPKSFLVLDASILDDLEEHTRLREDVKQNRIEFIFPDDLNEVDVTEECRALTMLDDFDTMYDLSMQLLVGKSVLINMKNFDGSKTELCNFQVVDRYQNLRAIEAINDYPCLLMWMTEFIGAHLLKKFPVPTRDPLPPQEPEETKKTGSRKKR